MAAFSTIAALALGAAGIGSSLAAANQQKKAQQEALRQQEQAQKQAMDDSQKQMQQQEIIANQQMAMNERLAADQIEAEKLMQAPPTAADESVNQAVMGQIQTDAEKKKKRNALSANKTRNTGGGFLGGIGGGAGIGVNSNRQQLLGQ